jgi:hypothetical protein
MSVSINGTTGLVFNDGSTQTTAASGFAPTALLVVTHNLTGLKYFCKTSRLSSLKYYKGSGVYWKRHLKKHGGNVSVGVLGVYFDKERCTSAANKFSEENKIVFSSEWANLIAENGLDGAPVGESNPMFGKPSPSIGQKRPWVGKKGSENPMWGKPSPMLGKKNIGASLALRGRKRPEGGGKKPHPVIRIDADGIEKSYCSVAEAAKDLGISRSCIHTVCTGKNKTGAGYKWRYAEGVVCQ